jgi:hypothetical protein
MAALPAQNPSLASTLRLLFMSVLLFVLEIVLFHVLRYVADYLDAMAIIAYALLGIGLGGLVASRVRVDEGRCFLACALGTWIALLLCLVKIVKLPTTGASNLVLASVFFFPGLYVALAFRSYRAARVYLVDLTGAGGAVLLLYVLYGVSYSEMILLLALLSLAVAGATDALRSAAPKGWPLAFAACGALSLAGVVYQVASDGLDLYRQVAYKKTVGGRRSYPPGSHFVRFYDNLVARVEVLRFPGDGPEMHFYTSDGLREDEFDRRLPKSFRRDLRLVGNLVPEPRIFIIGTAGDGIVKTAKYLTRQDHIDGVEINPSIHLMMTRDFVEESGHAYAGLDFAVGNALGHLADEKRTYDIVTLMNSHSMPMTFLPGPPDFLHSVESYRRYFEHLSDEGYVMLEERPLAHPGQYVVYRIVATIWQALTELGVERPEDHLFVYSWEWASDRGGKPFALYSGANFTSILARKTPLGAREVERIMDWVRIGGKPYTETSEEERARSNVVYDWLPGVVESPEYQPLFAALAAGDLEAAFPGWDLRPVTRNRAYTSQVNARYPEARHMLVSVGGVALLLLLPAALAAPGVTRRGLHARLLGFQLLIGFAYILIEVVLLQLYYSYFLSASWAFVGILATLLISSGLGGQALAERARPLPLVVVLLATLPLHAALAFDWLDALPLHGLRIAVILAATALSGFLMGGFFPLGVRLARVHGLAAAAGSYFAVNSIAGTTAVAASLYLSIRWGFVETLGVAAALYLLAALELRGLFVPARPPAPVRAAWWPRRGQPGSW